MHKPLRLSRREAMRYLSALAALGVNVSLAPRARAVDRKRRHLITIQGNGGWDTCWSLSPLLLADTAGMTSADVASEFYGAVPTPRFADDMAVARLGHTFGPMMNAFTAADMSKLLIWRGIDAEGGHGIGNRFLLEGHSSAYAAAFSVIIADALAKAPDYPRLLHYVQITSSPSDFHSQIGSFTGPGVPINVPDLATWTTLSASQPGDPTTSPSRLADFDQALAALCGATSSFSLDSTRRLFAETYYNNTRGAEQLIGKNYATSDTYGFPQIQQGYVDNVGSDFSSYIITSGPIRDALRSVNGLPSDSTGVSNFLRNRNIAELVFPYALAEFLIKQDLAAVVDLPTPMGDYHQNNEADIIDTAITLFCFKNLVRNLSNAPLNDGSGRSLLDITLVNLSSEFDRTIYKTLDVAGVDPPGTDHGPCATVVMAGYGANVGNVIGARGTGPEGALGFLGRPNRFGYGVPIDLATGLPSASGVMVGQRSFFHTIMKMFDVPVPAQQLSEAGPLPAAIKAGWSA